MSANSLDGRDDFDEQLRMQKLYGDTKDGDTQKDPGGETSSLGQQPDDTPYEWDLDKKAWFPKITEDFIATYQANYGFSNDGASSSTANVRDGNARPAEEPPQRKTPEPTDPKKRGEKRKAESGWFHVEEDRNTNVYVSGLPPDITLDEFIQLMSKFGIIMRDPQTEEFKVKLYKDNQGNLKGDGLCCYLKRESVELALKILDEDEIRGYKLHVEVAKFQLKGEYDASKKKKKCKDYKKKLSLQQKQLDWRPERRDGPSRMRHERVVIIKNMFHPMDFEDDPLVLNEIREDLRVECSKFGQIRKLLLFDRHPDGVASVSFRDPEEADYCIQTLDGRWFGGRQITAQVWDGTTDYQVEETTREREERLKGWEAFLNSPEANKGLRRSNSICASERAGPSRVRHFSEHPSTSEMNAQEAAAQMEFEELIDEKKFEKTEDGGELEEDAKESVLKKGAEENYPQKKFEECCLERKSEEGCLKKEFEEGSPKKESKVNGPRRECKNKQFRNDFEENGLEKESEEDGSNKESEEENSSQKESEEDVLERESEEDCSEKLFEDGSEKEFEENGLKKELDENGSDKEFNGNVLEKELEENDSERSEFDDDSSEKVFDDEGSEREFDEESDEKEGEDTYEKVFDDESDEKEDEEDDADEKGFEDADEKEEEDDADEKMFEYLDEKDDEVDAKEDEESIDENMFEDDESNEKLFEEDSCEKLFDDSDEKGTVGALGNVQEEGALSTGSSFILSSDDDDI
ncbi:HIV Tat-specific factor 1 isoform X1 [Molossus molossus]|uniref:17S U2 SnRNP complex component HTATSF1 n=1 Tax=Molossus molossus TaxID=27622 RepID=A0A7J8J5Z6_MOLMO|nr:HIV Tat-specific factor 1 isoform X1 [Molossus molossus]XP_036127565.1 HIV Tat-specific factor 1 isoform X1 [Molossus molossus]KAF6492243.1 HIV-1 Tat specific factor 1 [Molossus molossus]